MGLDPVTLGIGAAALGGVAGGMSDKSSKDSRSARAFVIDPASGQEIGARNAAYDQIGALDARLKSLEGGGALANLDKLLLELGQAPSQQRIDQSNQLANALFAPQETALSQALAEQTNQYAARAAQLGRSSADPILAARLAQEQIRQRQSLSAQKGAFAAQEAMSAPARLFQAQLGGLGGLSQQAIQNRQAVFGLGSDFANAERNFRLQSAGVVDTGFASTEEGGGFKGALTGLLGAAGSGAQLGHMLQSRPSNIPLGGGLQGGGMGSPMLQRPSPF
jgi:hypothetical protein